MATGGLEGFSVSGLTAPDPWAKDGFLGETRVKVRFEAGFCFACCFVLRFIFFVTAMLPPSQIEGKACG
jgi:hypothetical protein